MVARYFSKSLVAVFLFFAPLYFGYSFLLNDQDHSNQFIFLSNRDKPNDGFDICLYNIQNGKTINLTKGRADVKVFGASSPKFCRKRKSILYFSSANRAVMELSLTTRLVRLVFPVHYEAPTFEISSDDSYIIYTEKIDSVIQIFCYNLSDSSHKNLTNNQWNSIEPSISPDGNKIAYVSTYDGTNSIFVMDRDGSHQKKLTNAFGEDRQPKFSPDSKQIVFVSSRGGTSDIDYEVYTINVTGENFKLFYESNIYESHPAFIPNGNFIVFESRNALDKRAVILMKHVKTGEMVIVSNEYPMLNQNISLSADGRFLVFENNTFINCEIILYEIAKRKGSNITHHNAWDCSPSF